MDTRVCSLNVRGLGNKQKREQIFHWLREQSYPICLLQETHLTSNDHRLVEKEWKGQCYFSGKYSNKLGVCVLIDPNLNCSVTKHTEIVPGRVQALDITICEKEIVIINVYGPNEDDINMFNDILTYLNDINDKSFIIGGDFNTVMDSDIDKKNGRVDTHKNCRNKLKSILELHNLIDIWRVYHPNKKQFTWHSNTKPHIFSRLDYFLISDNLSNYTISSKIKAGYKTDHSLVEINLDFIQQPKGRGYFKMNNSLLLDVNYQTCIKQGITEIAEINQGANPNTLWELIKGTIRTNQLNMHQ